MKYLKTIILLIFSINIYVNATPTISSTSGTLTDGESLTISGTFESKSTPAPIKWDNFEWGTDGTTLDNDSVSPEWEGDTPSQTDFPEIDTSQKHSGTRSAYVDMIANNGDCAFYDVGIYFTGGTELYASYWIRYDTATGSDLEGPRADFFKFNRINSGSDIYGGSPSLLINLYPNYDFPETGRIEVHNYWNGTYDGHTSNIGRYYNNDMRKQVWHRVEMYLKLSNPGGTYTGYIQWFLDGVEVNTYWAGNYVDRQWNEITGDYDYITKAADSSNIIDTFSMLFGGCGYTETERPYLWQDDVYVDNTRARVEIGDNSVFENCTHREVQIPSAWATDEITVTVNEGSFDYENSTFYLFVVDSDGNASDGYEIDGTDTTAPTLSNFTIGTDGLIWTFAYSEVVTATDDGDMCDGYGIEMSAAGVLTFAYDGGTRGSGSTFTCTGSATVNQGDTIVDGLNYTQGSIEDIADTPNALDTIEDQTTGFTNGSLQGAGAPATQGSMTGGGTGVATGDGGLGGFYAD
jgi:hypothetical protein